MGLRPLPCCGEGCGYARFLALPTLSENDQQRRPLHPMTKENWVLSDQLDGGLSPSAARTTFEAAARFAFEATGFAVATLETTARRT